MNTVAAFVALGIVAFVIFAFLQRANQPINTPSNIKTYDVVDDRGFRHTCIENTTSGALRLQSTGMKQQQIADMFNVSRTTVQRVLAGKRYGGDVNEGNAA